jgi:hypothetical protein
MNRLTLFFCLLCISAQANPYDNSITSSAITKCNQPQNDDRWFLEPNPNIPGEYLFTYWNNIAECSDTLNGVGVETINGFRVILYVEVGVNDTKDELIYIIPEDPQYMSYPAELTVPDSSEPYTIRLIPGTS